MGTLRRGVAAPDEARGLDLVLLPDLRAAVALRISARRAFAEARSFGYMAVRRSERRGVASVAYGGLGARAGDQRALSQFFGRRSGGTFLSPPCKGDCAYMRKGRVPFPQPLWFWLLE